MRPPELLTFTGVDHLTSFREMEALADAYPVEWGVLFSPSRQGNARYATRPTIDRLVLRPYLRLAAHLCGGYSRDVMKGSRGLLPTLSAFSRIQVNHTSPSPSAIVGCLGGPRSCVLDPVQDFVAQTRAATFPEDRTVDWLFDASGGRGKVPAAWPPYPGRWCGYAGGIGPGNVAEVIRAIDADGPYWLDMETGVRTGDRFDVGLCRRVCEIVFDTGGPAIHTKARATP